MKVKIIIPYFGKLHPLFKLYLIGIKHNYKFDFLIVTDQDIVENSLSNLSIFNMSFDDFSNKIYDKLGVSPISPYKLCDYKPFYGIIFEEYLNKYDYWAYSDIDMILGDLNPYYQLMKKNTFDKILDRGHLSFYKNIYDVNYFYKSSKIIQKQHKYLLKSSRIWVIDESYSNTIFGVNTVLKDIGKILYSSRNSFFDSSPYFKELTNSNEDPKIPGFIEYKNNKIFFISFLNNQILRKEFSYAHFIKRNVKVIKAENTFILVPDSWLNINSYDECVVKLKNTYKLTRNKEYSFFLMKNKFKNFKILITDIFNNRESIDILFKILKFRK
jgi:hypothetical protein